MVDVLDGNSGRMTGCEASTPAQLTRLYWAGEKLLAARKKGTIAPPPPGVNGVCGARFQMNGNSQYGCCVSSWLAGNYKSGITSATGASDLVIPSANVIAWARQHNGLNGLNIIDAMVMLQTDGVLDADNRAHTIGKNGGIDHTNLLEVKLAMQYFRCLTLGVASRQLLALDTSKNGWVLKGAYQDQDCDHCIGEAGYGSAAYCAEALGLPAVPASLDPDEPCRILVTWGTAGIATDDSANAITSECHVVITDEDRGDAAQWDTVADSDYSAISA
jgi:hypothetical protein